MALDADCDRECPRRRFAQRQQRQRAQASYNKGLPFGLRWLQAWWLGLVVRQPWPGQRALLVHQPRPERVALLVRQPQPGRRAFLTVDSAGGRLPLLEDESGRGAKPTEPTERFRD